MSEDKVLKPIIDTARDIWETGLCLISCGGEKIDSSFLRIWNTLGKLRRGKMKEYLLRRKTPGILIKVPPPKASSEKLKDRNFLISKLGEVIAEAHGKAEKSTLTIIDVDSYLELLTEEEDG